MRYAIACADKKHIRLQVRCANQVLFAAKSVETPHQRVVRILQDIIRMDKKTYEKIDDLSGHKLGELIGRYTPDAYARSKKRKGKTDVFQVWCTQGKGNAFFDIMRALMIPTTGYLHIVTVYDPEWQWEENDVWTIKRILGKILCKPYKERLNQILKSGCVCSLTKEDMEKDDNHIKKKLAKWLGW